MVFKVLLKSGFHGPPGPGADRSESVQDFQIFVGPCPVRDLISDRSPDQIFSRVSV